MRMCAIARFHVPLWFLQRRNGRTVFRQIRVLCNTVGYLMLKEGYCPWRSGDE